MAYDTVEQLRLHLGENKSRYGSLDLIGAGAMGAVFKAYDKKLERTIALKAIHISQINVDKMRERFKREAKLLSSIRHRNIVQLFDFEEAGDICYLTEEYVEGLPLDIHIAEGNLSTADLVRIMAQLADGLQAVHETGVLHRDIKPNNIIIDDNGNPRLVDFGLAQSFEGTGATELTKSGYVVGTLGFISPEVLLGSSATQQSDVYQLGAVFYTALTGKTVYGQKEIAQLLKGEKPDQPLPPSTLGCESDEIIDKLILSCLSKNPEDRPSSAAAVREKCSSWLNRFQKDALSESRTLALEATSISSVKETSREKNRWPSVAFFSLLIAFFLATLHKKDPVVAIKDLNIDNGVNFVEVTWKTDRPTACTYQIRESNSQKFVVKGIESKLSKVHQIKYSKLAPATTYNILMNWMNTTYQATFKTGEAALTRPVFAVFLGGVFFADFSSTIGDDTRLVLSSDLGEELAKCGGNGPLTISGLGRPPGNAINWQVRAGKKVLASGRTEACQPQKPHEWAADQEPASKPLWMGKQIYIADKKGFLTCYELNDNRHRAAGRSLCGGLYRKWVYAPLSASNGRCATVAGLEDGRLLLVLRRRPQNEWKIGYLDPNKRDEVWQARVGNSGELPSWLHDAKDSWNSPLNNRESQKDVHCPIDIDFSDELAIEDNIAVLQGSAKGPCFYAFNVKTGSKLWFADGEKLVPKDLKKVRVKRQMLELDMGFSPVLKKGWGLLTSPKTVQNSIHSVIAFGFHMSEPVDCALLSVSLKKPKFGLLPFKGQSTRTFISNCGQRVSFSAGHEIKELSKQQNMSKALTSCKSGSLGPPITVNETSYCIHFEPKSKKKSAFQQFVGFQKASLAQFDDKGILRISEPPIFHEPIGAFQPTSVYAFTRWKDYLVGHTFFTVFVINLRTKTFGSWHSFEGGVVKSAISRDGLLAAVTRSGKVIILPILLVEKLRSGRLVNRQSK